MWFAMLSTTTDEQTPAPDANEISVTEQILGRRAVAEVVEDEPEEVPAELQGYYDRLVEVRDYLVSQRQEHTKNVADNQPHPIKEDLAESGTESFHQDYDLAMRSGYQEQLYEVEE